MKLSAFRRLSAALLAFTLFFSACGPAAPATESASVPASTASAEAVTESAAESATEPLTWDGYVPEVPTGTESLATAAVTTEAPQTEAPETEPATQPETAAASEDPAAEAVEIDLDAFYVGVTGGLAVPELLDEGEEVDTAEADRIERVMRAYQPSGEDVMVNNAESFYFYDQLTSYGQKLYSVMYMAASEPTGDNYVLFYSSADPSDAQFREDVNCVFWCMLCDHPELFWLYIKRSIRWRYASRSRNSSYWSVYFYVDEEPEFERMEQEFNQAAEAFLQDIDTSGTQEETARQIHDKLIHLARYDYGCAQRSTWQDIAHTAYAALVANSEGQPNTCVCDGYSAAFQYLLQQCGITACIVMGSGGDSYDEMGGHAWNMALLDGRWYEIDATWDDFGILDEPGAEDSPHYHYYVEMTGDPAFMETMEHWQYMLSTARISYFTMDPVVYYTQDGRYRFSFRKNGVHVRDCDDPDSWYPWDFVTGLLPIAE